MSEFLFRKAALAEVDELMSIAAACPEAPRWTREHYAEMLLEKADSLQQHILVIAVNEQDILGFAAASVVHGEAELQSIVVRAESRRQGIGHGLCKALLENTRSLGVTRMWLEVRSASTGAHMLYRQLGFVDEGTRRGYYVDPTDDAVLMSAVLS